MIILQGARPKTLTASLIPVVVGTALASTMQPIDRWLAFYSLFTALCIQIATNLINDALDFKKGADTPQRIGPVRIAQSGLLTPAQVLIWGVGFLLFGAIFGIPLVIKGGVPIALLLALSLLLAYLYTGGPYPLAYRGLGDVFVLLFFGVIATGGACYIQTLSLSWGQVLAGVQVGLLATLMIAINNLRDRVGDARANKRTLAVRYGVDFARKEIACCALGPFILGFFWVFFDHLGAALLPIMTLPFAMTLVRSIYFEEPGPGLNRMLGLAAFLHLTFGISLALGLLY